MFSTIPRSALILLLLLAVLWGVNWPIMKIALSGVSPWVFRSLAGLAGAAGLFLVARLNGYSLRVPRSQWSGLVVAAVLNMSIWNILVLYGIDLMNSGRAAILAYTMPLWASLISVWLLGERLSLRALLALLFGLLGMALLFWSGDPQQESILGPVLVVLAALSWGAGTVTIKYYAFSLPVTVLTAWLHLLGAVPIVIITLIWDIRSFEMPGLWPALCVFYNMTVTAVFCYWAYFKVVTQLPVVVSTVGTLMVPVLGVFSNASIFQPAPPLADYIALLAVGLAVFLVMTRKPA